MALPKNFQFSHPELARLESIAHRLVIAMIENTRDRTISAEFSVNALGELIGGPDKDPELAREEMFQVIWFLSFFAAAGAIGEEAGGAVFDHEDMTEFAQCCEKVIESKRKRLAYLSTVVEES